MFRISDELKIRVLFQGVILSLRTHCPNLFEQTRSDLPEPRIDPKIENISNLSVRDSVKVVYGWRRESFTENFITNSKFAFKYQSLKDSAENLPRLIWIDDPAIATILFYRDYPPGSEQL